MIRFKDKDEMLPSALTLLAIVVLATTTLFALLAPAPPPAGQGHSVALRRITEEILRANESGQAARKAVMPRLWQGDPDR